MEARALIGWNLRRLRVAKGLSQERLAFAAGIDRAYVGRVERGSENVTVSTLEAMAVALAVPVAALFIEPKPGPSRRCRCGPGGVRSPGEPRHRVEEAGCAGRVGRITRRFPVAGRLG